MVFYRQRCFHGKLLIDFKTRGRPTWKEKTEQLNVNFASNLTSLNRRQVQSNVSSPLWKQNMQIPVCSLHLLLSARTDNLSRGTEGDMRASRWRAEPTLLWRQKSEIPWTGVIFLLMGRSLTICWKTQWSRCDLSRVILKDMVAECRSDSWRRIGNFILTWRPGFYSDFFFV